MEMPASRATSRCQPVQRLAHGSGHAAPRRRIHHRVGDAAHQVLAEADLRIRRCLRRRRPRRWQIARGARRWWSSRCRPRGRRRARASPGQTPMICLLVVDRDRDLPVAGPQHRLQRLQHRQIAVERRQAPLPSPAPRKAGAGHRTDRACRARGTCDVVQAHDRMSSIARASASLRTTWRWTWLFRRHVDDDIGRDRAEQESRRPGAGAGARVALSPAR